MDGDAQLQTCPQVGATDANTDDARGVCSSGDLEANPDKPPLWQLSAKSMCGTSTLIALIVIGTLINCTSFLIGLNAINDCPVQDAIPVYLVASGLSGLIKIPFFAYLHLKKKNTASKTDVVLKRIYHLLIAVGVGLFVMGSFVVYQEFPSFQHGDANYCDKICYYYAFWFISCIYFFILFVISILITTMLSGLIAVCLGCAIKPMSAFQESDPEYNVEN